MGNTFAGAGAGHLEYRALQLESGAVIQVRVGGAGAGSSVTPGDAATVTAEAGGDSHATHGGDGYSGGGDGPGSYSGGENGGDGEGAGGGAGTGEDISAYTFRGHALGPGAGGLPFTGCTPTEVCGGGGGGVLVDGAGPGTSEHSGQGYGGGDSSGFGGSQGVVIVEVA